jgi:hypothetical protein
MALEAEYVLWQILGSSVLFNIGMFVSFGSVTGLCRLRYGMM